MAEDQLNRKGDHNLSLFNPDYILESAIHDFLLDFSSQYHYQTILDYGAGNSPYQSLFHYENYIKADIAQNSNHSIDLILTGNAEPTPLTNDSVDCILCMDVLEHSGNLDAILSEFYRLLKDGGVALISIPFMYREHEMPYDLVRYTSSGLLNSINNTKFNLVGMDKVGNISYVLYSLWLESIIKSGEKIQISFKERLSRKIFNTILLPICNKFVFHKKVDRTESVFHHLLISLRK